MFTPMQGQSIAVQNLVPFCFVPGVTTGLLGLPSLMSSRARSAVSTYKRNTRKAIATAAVKLGDLMVRACPAKDEKIARKKLL